MEDEKIKKIAQKVISKSGIPEDTYGSVLLILMFVSIIITTIRVLQECDKAKWTGMSTQKQNDFFADKIRTLSSRRGWYTKMRLKKIIRRELKPAEYKKYKNQIVDAILDVAEKITDEETCTLMGAL